MAAWDLRLLVKPLVLNKLLDSSLDSNIMHNFGESARGSSHIRSMTSLKVRSNNIEAFLFELQILESCCQFGCVSIDSLLPDV